MKAISKILSTALIFGVLTAGGAAAYEAKPPVSKCREAMMTAAIKLGKNEFSSGETLASPGPPRPFITVKASNDILCQKPEYMANVVIVVESNPREAVYGIFHIHFSENGVLHSAASDDEKWHNMSKPDAWKIGWCDFIKSVYPQELKEQGCE